MAETRRYPNVLPSYKTNHSVNGTPERVDEREKAKIARERNVDPEASKEPFPLFPSPKRVEENSLDGISNHIKNILGDFRNFTKIINQGKNPGIACIGVDPVPGTPTDTKKQYFGSGDGSKVKEKQRGFSSISEKTKAPKMTEKPESKSKLSSELTRHKAHKSDEKSSLKNSGESKSDMKSQQTKGNRTSVEKSAKTVQSMECANGKTEENTSVNKLKSSTPEPPKTISDSATKSKSQEVKANSMTVGKKSEDCSETHQESNKNAKSDPPQRTRPTPIQIPSRDNSSSSPTQSPNQSDMKVHNILKIMTEPVTVPPLTGIFTPVPKQDCRFPFPSNSSEDVLEVSDRKNSLGKDLALSEDDESDDELETKIAPDSEVRVNGYSRSRLESSSSSSSSGESNSSDSEGEEPTGRQNWNVTKDSMLNAISPSPAAEAEPARTSPSVSTLSTSTPKTVKSGNSEESDLLPLKQTSPNVSKSKEILGKRTNSDNASVTNEPDFKQEYSGDGDINSQCKTHNDREDATLKPGGQLNSQSGLKPNERSVDTRVKTEPAITGVEYLGLKSEDKNVLTVTETKDPKTLKDVSSVQDKSVSCKLGKVKLKDETGLNGVVRPKKHKDVRIKREKEKLKTKNWKSKPEVDCSNSKKTKRKGKDKTHSQSNHSHGKKKGELYNSKHATIKTVNKEIKNKKDRLDLEVDSDNAEEEDSVIDVVGYESPVKKKKTDVLKKEKLVNGLVNNGHEEMPLDIQVVRDQDKEPKSLLVKIDLSYLKRIPKKVLERSNFSVNPKHTGDQLLPIVNGSEPKAKKKEHNGDNVHGSADHTLSEKKGYHIGYSKRSPIWDDEHSPKKRMRRDSEREMKVTTDKIDGHKKTIEEVNAEVEEDIKKVNPDTHLQQAKTLKREADKLSGKEAKSRTYVEAILRFISCGRALEVKEDAEQRASQMYSETTELLRFVLKHVLGKSEDKRLLILCLRIQSILLHKLYRTKSKQAVRNSQVLAEHFKATQKNNITSPYTTSNKHASTPSPMSPTPSPAGSVGSIGSNSSNEGNNGSSQNGRHLPHTSGTHSSVTSPVSISIPQRVHTVMSQHVSTTSKLVHSIDIWEKADTLMSEYQEFFTSMNSMCGALTFHSSIAHIVNYVKKSLSKIQDVGEKC